MADRAVQGQARYYLGGTLPDCSEGIESRTKGVLPTGLAPGCIAIRLGAPASRGCGLAQSDHQLLSHENTLARLRAAADSIRERGRGNPFDFAKDRPAIS